MIKLAYIIDSMYNSGGMERVLTVCSNVLCTHFSITIITAFQQDRPYYFRIDPKINQNDLGLDMALSPRELKKKYKRRISDILKKEHFDIVISLGGMDFDFLHSIQDGSIKMVWFHFVLDFNEKYLEQNAHIFLKIKAKLQTWKRICYANKYNQIIVISKNELSRWSRYSNKATLIYNPISIEKPILSNLSHKCVIAVGRLDFQKGFDYLIDVWKIVAKKHPDWHLNIYGEGPLRDQLQRQINHLDLQDDITLCGRTPEIEREYVKHSIFVMSSRAEGFGLVLVEAASCGLPLVAFNCPSGPCEIVEDKKNGFLVDKVGDVKRMAECICELIDNKALRLRMGENARRIVTQFSIAQVREMWIKKIEKEVHL